MSMANPLWGAPRIHGELLKLGIEVSQATVGRYMPWRPKVPSPTWRSFLRNHMCDMSAVDMFVVATATFQLLYALIVLGHDRRRVIHFEVTPNPTQIWLARQMTEAFPWDTAPRYLLRDRDASYGQAFRDRVQAMAIKEVVTAARSPWQNPYVERIIGSIRRECLNHVIIYDERHLRGVLSSYFCYYHKTRSLARQGLSGEPHRSPTRGRQDHRVTRGRWTASSLRAPGCVNSCGHRTDTPISVSRVIPLCNRGVRMQCRPIGFRRPGRTSAPNVPFG
jgi:hypothetical protein